MTISELTRFADKVRVESNGCWHWTAAKDEKGYARFRYRGKNRRAHRVLFEALRGPMTKRLECDHLCRNTSCVNPRHIEAVTRSTNIRRGDLWQYRVTHCPQGHAYEGDNIIWQRDGRKRACRKCTNERTLAWYHKQRARQGVV